MTSKLNTEYNRATPTIVKGRDSFGTWRMVVGRDETTTAECPYCGAPCQALIAYTSGPKFPSEIKVASTVLKRARGVLGVSCGCYAKLVRQICHIAYKGMAKGYPI